MITVIQALNVETSEDHSRFAIIHISCEVVLDKFGIKVQDVNNSVLRDYIQKGVSEAVHYEEEDTEE